MMLWSSKVLLLVGLTCLPCLGSTKPSAVVRPLGPVVRISPRGVFGSVSAVRRLQDGRVIVSITQRLPFGTSQGSH
jgi:hypothetical protein